MRRDRMSAEPFRIPAPPTSLPRPHSRRSSPTIPRVHRLRGQRAERCPPRNARRPAGAARAVSQSRTAPGMTGLSSPMAARASAAPCPAGYRRPVRRWRPGRVARVLPQLGPQLRLPGLRRGAQLGVLLPQALVLPLQNRPLLLQLRRARPSSPIRDRSAATCASGAAGAAGAAPHRLLPLRPPAPYRAGGPLSSIAPAPGP